jgi:SAM-dependent methyltransferase
MPIDAKKNEPTPYGTAYKCVGCGTAAIQPSPPRSEVAGFYDLPAYYTHGTGHYAEVRPSLADKILAKIAWWLDRERPFNPSAEAKAGDRIIDLGCGHGALLSQFKEMGCLVTGVDPDPAARETAGKNGVPVLDGTAEALPSTLERGSFDLVVMSHSLEHCLDPMLALRNAFDLTKPGGKLYVEVPNCGCVHFETLAECSENFDAPRHLWFFTAEGLTRAVSAAGFEPAAWRYHGFTRHHLRSWREWEKTIADRLAKIDPARKVPRHSYAASVGILARSAFVSFDRKYDAIGMIAVRDASG